MKYTKKVLSNGLRIITVPMKNVETAMAMVLVEAGSEYEDKKINGLSHFLEHMCFKGTKNRSCDDISYEFDSMGATNNAFTGDTYTGYYGKARYEKINKILDIIFDMYANPTFPEKDIEIERGVILEEMNMYEDLPMRRVGEFYDELVFGDQPAGRRIIGTVKNIKSFKRKDFQNYYKKHYIPQKTVVVISGKIDEKSIQKSIKDTFGKIKNSKYHKKPKTTVKYNGPGLKIITKNIDQTHVLLGFQSFDLFDKRNPILEVAATILGSGMSSRLFKKMRVDLGVCYYVSASNSASLDHGNFAVKIGAANSRAIEAINAIIEEFKKLRDGEISEKELQKAKDILLGRVANNLETPEDWAHYYGAPELFRDKILTPKEYEKKIRSISVQDIKKVLKEIMTKKRMNMALIGPHKDKKKFKKILTI